MNLEKIKEVNDETLHQMAANALHTSMCALGHGKAANNRRLFDQYHKEMTRRGIKFDQDRKGMFNGQGAG